MAHIVALPVSFEFRTTKVRWQEREARIGGLSFDPFGKWELRAEATAHGRRVSADLSQRDIPPRLWDQCSDAIDESHDPDEWEQVVERICSDFRPRLFFASTRDDSEESSLPADAWQLRDAFLRVAPDAQSLLELLNRWGRWTYENHTQLETIVRFQESVRRALVSSPEEWLSDALDADLELDSRSEYPFFTIETVECKRAISATVTIDLLREVKFEPCARWDCGQPFSVTSRHKRKYCTQYCGHLESVRKSRARLGAKSVRRSRARQWS
jgi:hypothetical protein